MTFTKAAKRRARLRLAFVGPSGSGKTMSALRVATGIGGRIALIDTERGSASLYADKFNFDVLELSPPYHPAKYIEALREAQQAGYELVIIDSLSHAWAGEGGVLEQVDNAKAGGNNFTAWGPATKLQNKLVSAILDYPGQILVTLRAKQEYAIEKDPRTGKNVPRKLGLGPVQRDGVEYEFGTVLDIGMDHMASVGLAGKDRTDMFTGEPRQLTEDDGKRIAAWLKATPVDNSQQVPITQEAAQEVLQMQREHDEAQRKEEERCQLALNWWTESLEMTRGNAENGNKLLGYVNAEPTGAVERRRKLLGEYARQHKWKWNKDRGCFYQEAPVNGLAQIDREAKIAEWKTRFNRANYIPLFNEAWDQLKLETAEIKEQVAKHATELAEQSGLAWDTVTTMWVLVPKEETVPA